MRNQTRLLKVITIIVKKRKSASSRKENKQYIKLYESDPRIEQELLKAKEQVHKCARFQALRKKMSIVVHSKYLINEVIQNYRRKQSKNERSAVIHTVKRIKSNLTSFK